MRVSHDAARLGFIGLVTKHHGAQAQARDLKWALAEPVVLHAELLAAG
jgi:hypothetical protein